METLFINGTQLATFSAATLSGSGSDTALTLTGVSPVGTESDVYTVIVSQTNGANQFQNGQFVTILAPDNTIVLGLALSQPEQFQNLGAGDEHLVITDGQHVIDLGGFAGPTVVYSAADETATDGFGDNDGELDFADVRPTAPCFAEGTLIMTVSGERDVAELTPGDMIPDGDRDMRKILWIGRRRIHVAPNGHDLPVLISKGSLGHARPSRDLVISSQHRVRIDRPEGPALAPAKCLIELQGIRVMRGRRKITYYTVLLDRHAVLTANGAAAESFYPGHIGMMRLGDVARRRIEAVLPILRSAGMSAYPPALPFLTVREGRDAAEDLEEADLAIQRERKRMDMANRVS